MQWNHEPQGSIAYFVGVSAVPTRLLNVLRLLRPAPTRSLGVFEPHNGGGKHKSKMVRHGTTSAAVTAATLLARFFLVCSK